MESQRFKSDPYNPLNRLVTREDIASIGNSLNISLPSKNVPYYILVIPTQPTTI